MGVCVSAGNGWAAGLTAGAFAPDWDGMRDHCMTGYLAGLEPHLS
ncbi:hypothetical protein [Streptomyces sp. NPDC018610]